MTIKKKNIITCIKRVDGPTGKYFPYKGDYYVFKNKFGEYTVHESQLTEAERKAVGVWRKLPI